MLTQLKPNNVTFLKPVHISQHHFKRREFIPARPNQIWQIEQGFVRTLTWDTEGSVATLGLWGPGDIVGAPLTQADPYSIICLSPVVAQRWVNRCHWSIESILSHGQQTEALLQIIRSKRICDRLYQFLLWLAQRFGHRTDQGLAIDLQITHQEIAETLGTSRVTITRLLKQLQQEGVIYRSRKRYLLLSPESTCLDRHQLQSALSS